MLVRPVQGTTPASVGRCRRHDHGRRAAVGGMQQYDGSNNGADRDDIAGELRARGSGGRRTGPRRRRRGRGERPRRTPSRPLTRISAARPRATSRPSTATGGCSPTAAATVGDVQTLGADLVEPRDAGRRLGRRRQDREERSDHGAAGTRSMPRRRWPPQSPPRRAFRSARRPDLGRRPATTPLVPEATIERVQLAEDDLARAGAEINADTALVDAGAAYNSAALALEIAWLNLLNDAGCVSEQRQADAVAQLTAYTTGAADRPAAGRLRPGSDRRGLRPADRRRGRSSSRPTAGFR